MKTLVQALRCSVTVPDKNFKCDPECTYRVLEPIDPQFGIPADVEINGTGYWVSCDFDRMSNDAADIIEQYEKAMEGNI